MKTRPASRAFTLVEVLVAVSLSSVVFAAVLSSFVFLGRNLVRLANYQALETKSREALTYLQRDLGSAQAVKPGTSPTASAVTLVLPGGDVTYSYDSAAGSLRRQAASGANRDFILLKNDRCVCATFAFDYESAAGGDSRSQLDPTSNVPYGIKRVLVRFELATPSDHAAGTRTTYAAVSARFLLRNKQAVTGS